MGKASNKVSDAGLTNQLKNGTTILGDLNSTSDTRIDGIIKGNVTVTGRVVIGETGEITGNVTCSVLEISGKVTGKLKVKERLSLKATAIFSGDMITEKLVIEPGAIFNGTCQMGNSNEIHVSEKK